MLMARYAEPHRAYHTARHLAECFTQLDLVRRDVREPAAVELAIWFHDAIYWPRRSDNEQASADLATVELQAAGAAPELIRQITTLILGTAHHDPPPPGDGEVLADIDLAILGAAPERFFEYERQVRVEYRSVPSFLFRLKRATLLRAFLARPRIYATPFFHDGLELQARTNLAAAVAALSAP